MPSKPKRLSRRTLLKRGASYVGLFAGGLIGQSGLAQMITQLTPRQSLGPFFPDDGDEVEAIRENLDVHLPISHANDSDLTFIKGRTGTATGQVVYVRGKVFGQGKQGLQPLSGTPIIMWSASASGRYNHKGDEGNTSFPHPKTGEIIRRIHDEHFQYWGRAVTTKQGDYRFKTIVPGFYPIDLRAGIYRPSHLHFQIIPQGFPPFVTQLYFRGEQIPNNDLNQELLPQDVVVRSAQLTPQQQEHVIVDYAPDPSGTFTDGLVGHYDFVLPVS